MLKCCFRLPVDFLVFWLVEHYVQLIQIRIWILQPGSEHKPPIEEVRVLQATQSLPVWMPSTVSCTDAPEAIAEEVATIKTPPLTPRAIEESNHSRTPESGTPVKGNYFNIFYFEVLGPSNPFTCLVNWMLEIPLCIGILLISLNPLTLNSHILTKSDSWRAGGKENLSSWNFMVDTW